MIISTIPIIQRFSRPPTIFLTIISAVINSIYLKPFWFFSHISKEVFKMKPAIANLNSTTTVVREFRVAGVKASAFHAAPRSVCLRLGLSFRWSMSMLCNHLKVLFNLKAPAGLGSAAKASGGDDLFGSAIALAVPPRARTFDGARDHRKATEFLSRKINESWHNHISMNALSLHVNGI